MIHVCSLARLHDTVAETGARHVVTLLGRETNVVRPAGIDPENHLWLQLHDIAAPLDGHVLPAQAHVEELISFVRRWDRSAPLVVHCYAGVSRSTAAAFVAVCALSPHRDERAVAAALRRASPTALPNRLIVTLADRMLERRGRMIEAIEAIGPVLDGYARAVPARSRIGGMRRAGHRARQNPRHAEPFFTGRTKTTGQPRPKRYDRARRFAGAPEEIAVEFLIFIGLVAAVAFIVSTRSAMTDLAFSLRLLNAKLEAMSARWPSWPGSRDRRRSSPPPDTRRRRGA